MPDPYVVKPDREFLQRVLDEGGCDLKKCFQCATCSVVCELNNGGKPFPRKEMIWAQWGLKDRLLTDPDVWLCHQCDDCSTHCPRGARPGDVMAAIRQEGIQHYAVPRFLAKWVNQPKYLPLVLFIPTVLLGLLVLLRATPVPSDKIVYSYWNKLPHWVLISFFTLFSVLVLVALVAGAMRFWRAMKDNDGITTPAKGVGASFASALKSIFVHDKFNSCTTERSRSISHMCVFYGFIALAVVPIWIVTAKINPLLQDFSYPFNFWNPWRMLANLGGVVVLAGCGLMVRDRMKKSAVGGRNTYFDWAFLGTIIAVVLTGFASEVLHYVRMEPHRQAVYFVHLVLVFALLMYLPYSKFAHLVYRTTAMAYAEYSGRKSQEPAAEAAAADKVEKQQEPQVEPSNA
jgi:quinone-modifying oxidoreductase subunit QmoC